MVGDDTDLNSCVAQAIAKSLGYVPLVTAQIIEQLTQQRQVSVRILFSVHLFSPCCKSGRMHATPFLTGILFLHSVCSGNLHCIVFLVIDMTYTAEELPAAMTVTTVVAQQEL